MESFVKQLIDLGISEDDLRINSDGSLEFILWGLVSPEGALLEIHTPGVSKAGLTPVEIKTFDTLEAAKDYFRV